jgi:thiol-disulfide isomerase/thioredoxin
MKQKTASRWVLLFFSLGHLLSAPQASAAELKTADKAHVAVLPGGQIEIVPEAGFHLNQEAPASLIITGAATTSGSGTQSKIQPTQKSAKKFVFSAPAEATQGQLNFFVCDDRNTVCEPHTEAVTWGSAKAIKPAVEPSTQIATLLPEAFSRALKESQKRNGLVLLDFSASWCPPCIRLEHEVFNKPDFKKLMQRYVFVQFDIDREEIFPLLQKYSVKAFPTLAVVNSSGEEVDRFLDYQERKPFLASLAEIEKRKPATQAELIKEASAGNLRSSRELAESYYKSLQFDKALQWYQRSLGPHYFETAVNFWEEKASDGKPETITAYRSALRDAIAADPDGFNALDWRLSLANSLGKTSPEAITVAKELSAASQRWIDQPQRIEAAHKQGLLNEIRGLEIPEAYAHLADAAAFLGDPSAEQVGYRQAVGALEKTKPSERTPTQVLYLIGYLKHFAPLEQIEPWLIKLESAYPKEYTYHYRHAKLLMDHQQNQRALEQAKAAYELSYGNNRFLSGLLLAEIQNELKLKTSAKTLLQNLLASPEAHSPRNEKTVHSLDAFLKKLST